MDKIPPERINKLLEILPQLASSIEQENLIVIKQVNSLLDADHTHIRVIDWVMGKLNLVEYVSKENKEPEFLNFHL